MPAQIEKFKVDDFFNLEVIDNAEISPDGRQIAYTRSYADIMTDEWLSNIWIIHFDGSGHRRLTSGKFSNYSPKWAPDGRSIYYISNRNGSSQVYRHWMDNGGDEMISNLVANPRSISISPDNKWIAFMANVPLKPKTIIRMPEAPKGAKWAEPAKVIDRLIYRFDQVGYSYGENYRHLFIMQTEGGTPRQLSSGNFNYSGPLTWSRDSKYIILSANRREDCDLDLDDRELYRFSIADGSMKPLTDRRGPDKTPAASPDGKYIAYTGYDDKYVGHQNEQIYIMNVDGTGHHPLLKNFDFIASDLQWSADSKSIYFLYTEKGNTKLAFTDLAGKVTTLTGNIGGSGSAYGGGTYSISSNDRFVITYSDSDIMSDLAVGSILNPKTNRITSINSDIFDHKKTGKVEEIWYKSSFDNRDIQGWIIKPPDFDPSKKYPLILEMHGGPFAEYGDRFDIELQSMASEGFVVLYTNPRGSTSYGEEFANLIHHAYPGNDFYDLMSGVDAVIAKGYIDTDNLFVTGGSGGGVLTCWLIGKTDRFRAAASLYPVINWYSWTLTTDISYIGVKYWFPGFPWDFPGEYEKRSLLSVVKNVKTPTMVMCGENDYRCPITESEQYYTALKLLGVETVLVRVPDEPHGISNRPSHQISKILHIVTWFNQHKKQ